MDGIPGSHPLVRHLVNLLFLLLLDQQARREVFAPALSV